LHKNVMLLYPTNKIVMIYIEKKWWVGKYGNIAQ